MPARIVLSFDLGFLFIQYILFVVVLYRERRLQVLVGAAQALWFMHGHRVIHSDLTSYNILITSEWVAKVCAVQGLGCVERHHKPASCNCLLATVLLYRYLLSCHLHPYPSLFLLSHPLTDPPLTALFRLPISTCQSTCLRAEVLCPGTGGSTGEGWEGRGIHRRGRRMPRGKMGEQGCCVGL